MQSPKSFLGLGLLVIALSAEAGASPPYGNGDWFVGFPAVIDRHDAAVEPAHGSLQLCWARGTLDGTMYYAEALDRDDRSASFEELLTISGIEHAGATCLREDLSNARVKKQLLLKKWRDNEIEVINTTFMYDLD